MKSGQLVEFLGSWRGKGKTLVERMEELWIALDDHHYIELHDVEIMQLWLQCLIDVGYKFPELNFKSAISPPKYQQSNATRRGGKSFSYHPFHTQLKKIMTGHVQIPDHLQSGYLIYGVAL